MGKHRASRMEARRAAQAASLKSTPRNLIPFAILRNRGLYYIVPLAVTSGLAGDGVAGIERHDVRCRYGHPRGQRIDPRLERRYRRDRQFPCSALA